MRLSAGRNRCMAVDDLDPIEDRPTIEVEVVFAEPERQELIQVRLPQGGTVQDAITVSGIQNQFPDVDLSQNKVGIFGKKTQRDRVLENGDRVEIYRPLKADPKEVRRALAALGKTMGKKG